MTTSPDPVLVERHGPVRVITLNRPSARNALNAALAGRLIEALADNQDARAIVLTGADPAFCAGLDLKNLGVERLADLPDAARALGGSNVPLVCAANGPAVTGGFELALACDFIIASERATFADTHARVGVFPGSVLLELPRRIGMARAREMSLTGNFVDARRAEQIGLVNHVVPHSELLGTALGFAAAIAESDPGLIAKMRNGWTRTESLDRAAADVTWRELADQAHGDDIVGADIARYRETVLERSREQRGV